MNKERELLIQALEDWDFSDKLETLDPIFEDIRTHLSTSDDADNPVAWMFQHEDTGLIDFVDTQQVEWGFEKNNPRWQKIGPVYTRPKPAEPEAEYDFYGVIPLTHRKAKGIIKDRGYHVTGFVLSRPDGDKCIVDMSAVRWLSGKEFFEMMHPPVVSPTAEPAARKPMTEEEIPYHGSHYYRAFLAGVRFAEKHHGITDADV